MKKVLFSLAIVVATLLVASCGKKVLEGETINTRYYTVIVPNGYKLSGAINLDKSLMIVKLNEDGKTVEKGNMAFNVTPFTKTSSTSDPKEMRDHRVKNYGAIDKGEQKHGENTYFVAQDDENGKLKFYTKLGNDAVLTVDVFGWDFEDPIIGDILDNVVVKATPDAPKLDYDFDLFSVKTPEGWEPDMGSSSVRMESDKGRINVYTSTVPFEKVQENWKSFEKRGEMKVGDITWLVFANDNSKNYNLLTDIVDEPNKALVVSSYKVLPDDPDMQKVL